MLRTSRPDFLIDAAAQLNARLENQDVDRHPGRGRDLDSRTKVDTGLQILRAKEVSPLQVELCRDT